MIQLRARCFRGCRTHIFARPPQIAGKFRVTLSEVMTACVRLHGVSGEMRHSGVGGGLVSQGRQVRFRRSDVSANPRYESARGRGSNGYQIEGREEAA